MYFYFSAQFIALCVCICEVWVDACWVCVWMFTGVSTCMWVSVRMDIYAHEWVGVGRLEVGTAAVFLSFSSPSAGSPDEPEVHWFREASQPGCSEESLYLPSSAGITGRPPYLCSMPTDAENLNSIPHPRTAITLSTEPSPQPSNGI